MSSAPLPQLRLVERAPPQSTPDLPVLLQPSGKVGLIKRRSLIDRLEQEIGEYDESAVCAIVSGPCSPVSNIGIGVVGAEK